jgi:hypothetical protein
LTFRIFPDPFFNFLLHTYYDIFLDKIMSYLMEEMMKKIALLGAVLTGETLILTGCATTDVTLTKITTRDSTLTVLSQFRF